MTSDSPTLIQQNNEKDLFIIFYGHEIIDTYLADDENCLYQYFSNVLKADGQLVADLEIAVNKYLHEIKYKNQSNVENIEITANDIKTAFDMDHKIRIEQMRTKIIN